jgi:head-tail adaptor
MRAGELRHRVTILRPIYRENAAGERSVYVWNDIGTAFVGFRTASAKEVLANGEVIESGTVVAVARFIPGVTSECQIQFGARRFAIDGIVNEGERDRSMLLILKEQR